MAMVGRYFCNPVSRKARQLEAVRKQELWMLAHGGNRAGYIRHYGPEDDGAGIYDADVQWLVKLREDAGL